MGKNLFEEFPPVSREEWEKVIQKDLKGADYTEKLKWKTGEGIELLPFYRKEDLEVLDHKTPLYDGDAEKAAWEICQYITATEPEEGNSRALRNLERGADSILFYSRIHKSDGALGGDIEGLAVQDQKDFDKLLDGVPLENAAIHFDVSVAAPAFLAMLANTADSRGLEAGSINGTLLYDPYLYTATAGQTPKEEELFIDDALQMVQFGTGHLPGMRVLGIDARTYRNAGATIVQELAIALATGSEYLARLSEKGIGPEKAAGQIHACFAVGSKYFLEIAKLRAFRLLWHNIASEYGLSGSTVKPPFVRGETAQWNKTLFDPHTNMLRTSTEGMAASIAGYDAVTVHPYDDIFKQPDDFSERIARNTQVILKEESHFDKVADPAAGSFYIEKATDKIAREAWHLFQEIEQQGGIFSAIKNRTIANLVGGSAEERDRDIANRKRIFVGTNQYPAPDSDPEGRKSNGFQVRSLKSTDTEPEIDRSRFIESLGEAFSDGAAFGDIVSHLQDLGKQLFDPIVPYRGAGAFEELRLATENHEKTPLVLLLPIGNRKMRTARATFSRNFFGCAGYEIEDPIGFETVGDAVDRTAEEQPDIVVLCSSDEDYEELVEPVCNGLEKIDCHPITVLAGYPKSRLQAYRDAGVDEFIHARSNVLETLAEFQKKLGII